MDNIDKQILGKVFDKIFGVMYGMLFSYIVLTALLIMLERYKFESINYWLNNNSNIILAVNEFNKNNVFSYQISIKIVDFSGISRKSLIFRTFRVENVTFCCR